MVSVISFILFPILGIPIYIFCYLNNKNKKGILYSSIIGLTLGILAYYFIPRSDYDLYRHQLVVTQLMGINFNEFLSLTKEIDLEFLPMLYSYLISFTHNLNLLQFFVVSLGYGILFYILYDYRKISKIKLIPFIFVVLFTIFGFNTLYFISGLYYYIAVILFTLAFYNEYVKNGNKVLSYILYITTLFIHDSMLFALAILLIYKLFSNKFNFKSAMMCIMIFSLSFYVLRFFSTNLNIGFFTTLFNMYKAYITKNDSLKRLYSGTILFIEISKLITTIICIFLQNERKKFKGVNGFILLLSLSTLIMMNRSRVMIRFVMLIQFIGIVPMMDSLSKLKKNKVLLLLMIIILSLLYILYFIYVFKSQNFGNLKSNVYMNVFELFRRG